MSRTEAQWASCSRSGRSAAMCSESTARTGRSGTRSTVCRTGGRCRKGSGRRGAPGGVRRRGSSPGAPPRRGSARFSPRRRPGRCPACAARGRRSPMRRTSGCATPGRTARASPRRCATTARRSRPICCRPLATWRSRTCERTASRVGERSCRARRAPRTSCSPSSTGSSAVHSASTGWLPTRWPPSSVCASRGAVTWRCSPPRRSSRWCAPLRGVLGFRCAGSIQARTIFVSRRGASCGGAGAAACPAG